MNELNVEQLAAANFLDGIAAVVAVPGSGKTKTMMERIGILVNDHHISRKYPWFNIYQKCGGRNEKQACSGIGRYGIEGNTFHYPFLLSLPAEK